MVLRLDSSPTRRAALQRIMAGSAVVLGAPAVAQGLADKRLVIGQSAALTGPAAQLGMQFNRGANLVFERVNAEGGIHGRSIELRVLDDGYEPERCRANTEALIKDGTFALFGYVGTPTSLAALPLLTRAQVPFVAPFTGAQALREPFNRQVFHVRASYYDETALIVHQLTAMGLQRIAVLRQNDSYGQAGLDGVARALAGRSLKPVAVGLVERNSVDVASAVAAIVSHKPDAVVMIGAYKGCAAFIRAARAAGYGGNYYNVSFVGTQALADALGTDASGVVISQVMPYPFSTTTPIARDYGEAVRRAGGSLSANYSGIEGYIGARVFVEGLRRAGVNPSREALIAGLESLQHYSVGGHPVDFSSRDHVGSKFVELSMLTADGKIRR